MSYIHEDFEVSSKTYSTIKRMTPNFGFNGFGEIVYYRSYSRLIRDDFDQVIGQEDWGDTVLRVINGIMSIRKDWYIRNHIRWDESYWQDYARGMAISLFNMEWMPPGRGLWVMGTDAIRQRGAMPLYNCAFTEVGKGWIDDLCWLMDCSMCGVGVGFRPIRIGLELYEPDALCGYTYHIPDTREGWVESMRYLLQSYSLGGSAVEFDYSEIRGPGEPIKTFGGISSGPQPLKDLHATLRRLCSKYATDEDYDEVHFKTDLANLIGVCVISGNVRRSAEIALCEADDPVFGDLKNYTMYPERQPWGWMSNNSYLLTKPEHFEQLDEVALANIDGHDVGYLNMLNTPYGRLGKHDNVRVDKATGINPCGEIPLEHREVCNLAETVPTRCADTDTWMRACSYATFYCSTVTLLPTHHESTNAVIARNRRIGVSLMDFTGWQDSIGTASVIRALRRGYQHIREYNAVLAEEAGIPASIRVTTVKPGGTVPKLAGRTSGAGYPTFKHTLRRIRVGVYTPINQLLIDAGVPHEADVYTPDTNVFEYPILQGPARPATEVTLWEQAMNIVLLQREWADNAVSNTLYFKPMWLKRAATMHPSFGGSTCVTIGDLRLYVHPECMNMTYNVEGRTFKFMNDGVYEYNPSHEEDQIADVLAHIAPLTKSVSLLPHTEAGVFAQSPEEGITQREYEERLAAIKPIDWARFNGSDGMDEKFCTGDSCAITLST